tara:strand:- start:822 stop:1061 length:240 start_codon:yes stop_codon:yes gene_type:complete
MNTTKEKENNNQGGVKAPHNNKENTMPKSKWSKKTLSKVRKLAEKHSVNVKNFSDDDLKEFLNLFVKATDKVNKERNNA